MWGWGKALWPEYCVVCNRWLVDSATWMLACDICCADWPYLCHSEGSILMRERCHGEFAITGFRLQSQQELKKQIDAIKYGGDRHAAFRWGHWLGQRWGLPKTYSSSHVVLAPVPLHRRKKIKRGYNQAHWIARGLAASWGVQVAPRLLVRARHGDSLTGLSRESREAASDGLYRVAQPPNSPPQSVIVVDDVITTGSTIAACGHALESAGHRWLGAATLALA